MFNYLILIGFSLVLMNQIDPSKKFICVHFWDF